MDALITEATLRGLFSMYGEVVDVAIKKTQFDRKLKIQNGYGFVHYAMTSEGVHSAITATKAIHQVTIDRVTYDCSLSHALESIVGPEVAAEVYAPKQSTGSSLTMEALAMATLGRSLSTGSGGGTGSNPHSPIGNSPNMTAPSSLGFGASVAGGMPKPPPISTAGNQQLPPLPPHHHYNLHSSSTSPHPAPPGGGSSTSPHNSLVFPHAELEKKGLHGLYSSSNSHHHHSIQSPPSPPAAATAASSSSLSGYGSTSPTSSLMQAYYSGSGGGNHHSLATEGMNEFYGIADMPRDSTNHNTTTAAALSSAGYYSNAFSDSYNTLGSGSNRSSASYSSGSHHSHLHYQQQHHQHHRSYSTTSSHSSYHEQLSLSDSSSEIPFERLSFSDSRTSKPSPTNSLRSGSLSLNNSLDRSPRYAAGHHLHNPGIYLGGSGQTSGQSSCNNSIPLGSSSIESGLTLSSLSFDSTGTPQPLSSPPPFLFLSFPSIIIVELIGMLPS